MNHKIADLAAGGFLCEQTTTVGNLLSIPCWEDEDEDEDLC
jgi:hypothetical protein